jgi:hypothetical protein
MTEETFQGWSNRLTWLMNYHITNSEALKSNCLQLAYEYQNKYRLADEIESLVTDLVGKTQANIKDPLVYDLINHACWTVNWSEIAEDFLRQISTN